jgi:hypothetical protein
MASFDLDFASLCAAIAPERIPLRGNEHRIQRVAFDLFKLDNDKENLWQVQADDDGNEFLVRTYELPKDESIKAKSDWSVAEDSRKASLTLSYCGMPVHRLVAADYGAYGPDDVRLLRDLVQAKLADDGFAGRMLATLPEPKRAALAELFPKIAAVPALTQRLPLVPLPRTNDPLEGIPPVDLKKEYGIDPRKPSPKSFPARKPQRAEDDPWGEDDFRSDASNPANLKEAKEIVPQVMEYLKARRGKKISLQELYMGLGCNDQPLYLALHALVKGGRIQGMSPYDAPSPQMAALTGVPEMGHRDFFYSVESVPNADDNRKS